MKQLILASESPRRKQLLSQVGIPYRSRRPAFDETTVSEKNPEKLVKLLAEYKGKSVPMGDQEVVLSADTVVSYQGTVLMKPNTRQEAYQMLQKLNGNKHHVYTGVMIRSTTKQVLYAVETIVEFWQLSDKELSSYVEAGESLDKAGGYGIQAKGALLVKGIEGDYYNVVGLPISTVVCNLKEFQIFPLFS